MQRETTERVHRSQERATPVTVAAAGVVVGLVGVPALILAEIELGVLSALGLGGLTTLGALAVVPGVLFGALSLVVMLGS